MRRATVAVVALCALLTAGCGAIRSTRWVTPPAAPETASTDPVALMLRGTMAKTDKESHHAWGWIWYAGCESHGGYGFDIRVDPATKTLDAKLIQGAKTDPYYRIVKDDLYMHADLLGLKTDRDWVHFDMAKVSASSWVRGAFEGGATDATVGIVTAAKLSDTSYAGTIDLHLVQDKTRYDTPKADLGDQIDAMGDADASAVPFVARVDDQGRMTFLEMTTKRTVGRETCFTTQVTSMGDFGKPLSVKAPAADTVQEATEAQYRSL